MKNTDKILHFKNLSKSHCEYCKILIKDSHYWTESEELWSWTLTGYLNCKKVESNGDRD